MSTTQMYSVYCHNGVKQKIFIFKKLESENFDF